MHHVVIGTGPAGVVAAEALRKQQPNARITLIGGEGETPYSRMAIPYLLIEQVSEEGTYLRKKNQHYADNRIDLVDATVRGLAAAEKSIELDNGARISYDKLLLATGSIPVSPPIEGMDLPGVCHCWTLADAREIAKRAQPGSQVVLMGAGFIGCIILEALARRGVKLTVIEMADRMVPRMMNLETGNLIKNWCQHKGVNVLTSTRVTSVRQRGDALTIVLDGGDTVAADLLISATGVRANIGLAQSAGLKCDVGVLVNRSMQTSDPDVFAAGDCAQGMDFSTGDYSVQAIQPTAADHARIAAAAMCGLGAQLDYGTLNMNVLDTMGLISVSFGAWEGVEGGETAMAKDLKRFRYIELQFDGDVLVGANALGHTQHIGVLRGLIQSKAHLGVWKDRLMVDPSLIMEAYLATLQSKIA